MTLVERTCTWMSLQAVQVTNRGEQDETVPNAQDATVKTAVLNEEEQVDANEEEPSKSTESTDHVN